MNTRDRHAEEELAQLASLQQLQKVSTLSLADANLSFSGLAGDELQVLDQSDEESDEDSDEEDQVGPTFKP